MTRDQAIENAEKMLKEIRVMESAAHGLSLAKIAMREVGDTDLSIVENALKAVNALVRSKIDQSNDILIDYVLTRAQMRAVTQIMRTMRRHRSYEFKWFQMNMIGTRKISVIIEVGRVGDEGTYGSIIRRERRQYFVGVRGGLTLIKKGKTIKGEKALCGVFL